jgi:Flp pilus assembly pilin Flp
MAANDTCGERAATAIEYGLIATGIALVIMPALTSVGSS